MIRPRFAAPLLALAAPAAAADTVPFADTEDATLSAVAVGPGDVHAIAGTDLRNGDYARGSLDDEDDAGLGRVPVHVAIGGAIVLRRDAAGAGTLFLIGQSSNGIHAPRRNERAAPRAWYESNTIAGLAWRPVAGLTGAALYTIKASPNGIAATTHEASLSAAYDGADAAGSLHPRLAVTRRTQGTGGLYTIAGIAPEWRLAAGDDAPTVTLPLTAGIGWGGFYAAGSGTRAYASAGIALARPVRLAGARATVQAEVLALVRDDPLRRLDAPAGTTAAIVPLATLSCRMAW